MLKEQIQKELKIFGLNGFEHPIFYHCHTGIRFEIGVGDVYDNDGVPLKEYVDNALNRAMKIYNNGIKCPSILVWGVYPQNDEEKHNFQIVFQEKIASIPPQEEYSRDIKVDDNKTKTTEFYWDLQKSKIPMEKIFQEIILGDLGGVQEFVSSVYLFDIENHVMLHLYDDRGLDIVAYDKNTLMPLYQKFNIWILDYDRERINKIFLD
ncbi:MAG: DUF3885 domain-containing protein [Xylanivirga thermophila]|uniref:DUF3885 domain-containing protein n=1 Tax=Xylanivirga thermophila TaxID=2496273 RepID=UPI00101DAEDB|nr:DUF3885 domain-containing protein [Xylanivirga thermophila]